MKYRYGNFFSFFFPQTEYSLHVSLCDQQIGKGNCDKRSTSVWNHAQAQTQHNITPALPLPTNFKTQHTKDTAYAETVEQSLSIHSARGIRLKGKTYSSAQRYTCTTDTKGSVKTRRKAKDVIALLINFLGKGWVSFGLDTNVSVWPLYSPKRPWMSQGKKTNSQRLFKLKHTKVLKPNQKIRSYKYSCGSQPYIPLSQKQKKKII